MLAHSNLKQNMCLRSKESSFFPIMHCPLVVNRKMRWSIALSCFDPLNVVKLHKKIKTASNNL